MPEILDFFGEFNEPDKGFSDFSKEFDHYKNETHIRKTKKRKTDSRHEIGEIPEVTPEFLELRDQVKANYILGHEKVFTASTGLKPFGDDQKQAIRRFQQVVQSISGGKLVQAEPRGFAKTSRAVNQIVLGVLEGSIRFALIVSSEIGKSVDIMEQIQTELLGNDMLTQMYPGPMLCFQHADGKPISAKYQTYKGEGTHLGWSTETIRFPILPGEPSSGAVILVRTKDNLRGLSKKIQFGPDKGQVIRPDFVLLDDIQTDKDARSPTVCRTICDTIKRSALFGGSHSKKVRIVMTITPNRKGDVASHFMKREPSWEVADYSMIRKMPDNLDLWEQFGRILLNFDKRKEGDRSRAQRAARQFVQDNYDELHAGAEWSWDWAYEWAVDDPIELSALHHAMVFLYEEGEEAFNYECQCKLDSDEFEDETLLADVQTIESRISPTTRYKLPQEVQHVVTHVDMNHEILSYVTMASGRTFRPFVIDYGTFPAQPTHQWKKKQIVNKLGDLYPTIPEGDINSLFYSAIKDFSIVLARQKYTREDGVEMYNRFIGFDAQYCTDDVIRGIRESEVSSACIAMQGLYIGAKKTPLNEMKMSNDRELHFHCYTSPSSDKSVMVVRMDINYFKSLIHRGYNLPPGDVGSFRLFDSEGANNHTLYALHCNAEFPTIVPNVQEERVVVEWTPYTGRDNEYFDNTVGCCALLFKLGCTLSVDTEVKVMNIQDYINAQKGY